MSVSDSFLLSHAVLEKGEEASYVCSFARKRGRFCIGILFVLLFRNIGFTDRVSEAGDFVLKHELLFHEELDEVIFGHVVHVHVFGWCGWFRWEFLQDGDDFMVYSVPWEGSGFSYGYEGCVQAYLFGTFPELAIISYVNVMGDGYVQPMREVDRGQS